MKKKISACIDVVSEFLTHRYVIINVIIYTTTNFISFTLMIQSFGGVRWRRIESHRVF